MAGQGAVLASRILNEISSLGMVVADLFKANGSYPYPPEAGEFIKREDLPLCYLFRMPIGLIRPNELSDRLSTFYYRPEVPKYQSNCL